MECSRQEKPFKEKRKKKINLQRQESNETVLAIVNTSSGNANSVHEESIEDCLQILHEIVDSCFIEDSSVKKLDLDKGEATKIDNVAATDISIQGEVGEICEKTVRVEEQECDRAETDTLKETVDLQMQGIQKIREEAESTTKLEEITVFEAENNNIFSVNDHEIPEIAAEAAEDDTTPLQQTLLTSLTAEPVVNVDTLGKVCINLPNLSNIDYPDYDTYMRTFSTQEPEKELSELLTKTMCQSNNVTTEARNYKTLTAASRTKPIVTYFKADISYKFKTDELSGRILPHSPRVTFHSGSKKARTDLIQNYLKKNDPRFYELSWSHKDGCLCNESYWEAKPFLVDQAIYKVRCCVKLVHSPDVILLVKKDQETGNSSETEMSGSLESTSLSDVSGYTTDCTDMSTCDATRSSGLSCETVWEQKATDSKTSTYTDTDDAQISRFRSKFLPPQGCIGTTDTGSEIDLAKMEEWRRKTSEFIYYLYARSYNSRMKSSNFASRLPIPPIVDVKLSENLQHSPYPTEEELKARAPRPETNIYYIIEGITGLREETISPPFYVRNLTWQIKVMPLADQGGNNTSLSVYVLCNNESVCSKWKCKAEATFRLNPYELKCIPHRRGHCYHEFRQTFSHKAKEHHSHLIDWATLMDPTNCYVYDDDTIVLEIHLNADDPYEEVTSERNGKWKRLKNFFSNKSAVDPPTMQ